jgi:hypothetical protein
MTETSKTELEPNDQKIVEIPKIASRTHPPMAHISTPADLPEGKTGKKGDRGIYPGIPG